MHPGLIVASVLGPLGLACFVEARVAIGRFRRATDEQVRALLARAPRGAPAPLTAAELAGLPAPVRRWVEASGAVGRPRARTVRLRQRGEMRTAPGGSFAHAEATQYFTVDEPGFVWAVDVAMMGVPVVGRDSFVDGRGRMFIRAAGLVTVADGTGPAFDQGTLQRFLGEIVWFPSAAVAPYLAWEAVDDRSARATLTWRGVSGSAVFAFDERDRVASLSAQRSYNGGATEEWVIPITEWGERGGVAMPTRGGAVWKLRAGDFEYYRWEIVAVEENRPEPWGDDPRSGCATDGPRRATAAPAP